MIPFLAYLNIQYWLSWNFFLGGINHCVTVVGECMFDSNFPFWLPLTNNNWEHFCINDNGGKGDEQLRSIIEIN